MVTLSDIDIREMFVKIYPNEKDGWLYASYRLGLKTVLVKAAFRLKVPDKDPESVTAFNSGYLDGLELKEGREELERTMSFSTSTNKSSTNSKVSSPVKEYNHPF
jgi:hypothetical protein